MPKRNPKAFRVRGPDGETYGYGATEKEAWHNFYLREKRAGRVDAEGRELKPSVPLGKRKRSGDPFGLNLSGLF